MADDQINSPVEPVLLIDADILLYRCGFAVEKTKYLVEFPANELMPPDFEYCQTAKEAKAAAGDGCVIWSRKEVEPVTNALEATRNAMRAITSKFHPKGEHWKGYCYLTGKGNFRDLIEVDRGYKDNRDPAHRPKHYKAIKEYLITKWAATLVNGEEADDAIGRQAYSREIDSYVIISNDKDLNQLSGYHYDWTKDFLYYVNEEESLKFYYKQLLSGDATDNIKGAVSVARANELIDPLQSPHDCAVVAKEVYEKKYGDSWGELIDATSELVWIRRHNPQPNQKNYPFWDHLHGGA